MNRYSISIAVHNRIGVLNRVTAVFRRLQININLLALENADNTEFANIIFGFSCSAENQKLLVDRLEKIYDVCSISEIY